MGFSIYNNDFYKNQVDDSYKSASIVTNHLSKIFIPNSVADVGCGRGTWLKAFKELGTKHLVGFDGDWNTQEQMIDQSINFFASFFTFDKLLYSCFIFLIII